jgi:plasmid stability protein
MNANTNTDFCSVPEMMLMLRAPGAGWLATLLAALDEASHDPDFNAYHRAILARCLSEQSVPVAVAEAARQRTIQFEEALQATIDSESRHADADHRVAC